MFISHLTFNPAYIQPRIQEFVMGGGGGGGSFTRGAAMYAKLFERGRGGGGGGGGGVQSAYGYIPKLGGGGGAVDKLNEPIRHSYARILY